jgi:Family of unknown function (DUF6504)
MTRRHADPVEVHPRQTPRGPEPAEFVWRGRLHLVSEVLSSWTEAGGWWRTEALRALTSGAGGASGVPAGGPGPLATAPIPSSPKWAQRAWGEPAPDVGAALPGDAGGVDDGERTWWRVEATGPATGASSAGPGVYDLCFDTAQGTWALARVLD